MRIISFYIVFLIFLATGLFAQDNPAEDQNIYVFAKVIDGDTLITQNLPAFYVYAKMPRKMRSKLHKHNRLVYNVKKAYPYAKLAGIKLNEYEVILKEAKTEVERKKLMKQAEKELRDEFEDDLKKLTFKQGMILIKLVDRETGDSSYALIQELRGKFMAFFWQTFARLFGYNLKQKYDPSGEDKEIEEIVVKIEKGLI